LCGNLKPGLKQINMRKLWLLLLLPVQLFAQPSKEEIARWEKQAKDITIIRDNWDIPHIYGKTNADVVIPVINKIV
jgi:acyl-homoserine-lactone acylase